MKTLNFDRKNGSAFWIRNRSNELDNLLKPMCAQKGVDYTERDRFSTSNSIQFKDLGHTQRTNNLNLEKDDLRHTRRMMDMHNNKAISYAANVSNSIATRKDAINRLRQYVGNNDVSILKKKDFTHDPTIESTAHKFDWTPCRYSTLGWKYQERGSYQKHLNHSNKLNNVGGYGPN